MFAAVTGEIPLSVAGEVEAADATTAGDRLFPDRRVHDAPVPLDIAWQPDVHRQQPSHDEGT
jgi:hypothetical protein